MANATQKARCFSGLLQTEDLYQYILNTSVYPREPEPLKKLRDITAKHPRNIWATSPDAGQFMSLLLKLLNPKRTIELGVFTGCSVLLTALSIPKDGKIVAIDTNREAYEMGLPVIKKAGVEHKIEFVESKALDALDKLLEQPENIGSFDFAFVDADKSNQLKYHERLMVLVKIGGVIIYDNTLWGGTVVLPFPSSASEGRKAGWQSTIDFNKALAADSRVDIAQIALGDGITICKRIC